MSITARSLAVSAALVLAGRSYAQSTLVEFSIPGINDAAEIVGDTDGDGRAELVVGVSSYVNGAFPGAGGAFVYSGADGSLRFSILGTDQGDHVGTSVAGVGDANGDGHADLAVGAPDDDVPGLGRNAGTVFVLSGLDGSVLHELHGTRAGEFFGGCVAPMGDLDRDGHDDVLVGSISTMSPQHGFLGGSASVFSGADGRLLVRAFGDQNGWMMGQRVCAAGDVNGDGTLDFAAVQHSDVRVFSGVNGKQLWRRSYPQQGGSLVIAGGLDANGDGFDDFLVGAHMIDTFRGRVELVSGRDNTVLREHFGLNPGDELGFVLRATGDVDGDGYGDYAASIPRFNPGGFPGAGAVRGFSGRTGAVVFTIPGTGLDQQWGNRMGAGGDVDGDGFPDVVLCSSRAPLVRAHSFVPRGLRSYGTGTPGCAGPLRLLATGLPTLGNAAFEMHLAGAGASVSSLLMGDAPDVAGTMRFNALFHLDPQPLGGFGILSRTTLPSPDGQRSIVANFPIPNDPVLAGLTYYFQGVSFFPHGTCARDIATTPGLALTFQ